MQKLKGNHGPPLTLRALRFLGIRLKSRPLSQPMIKDVAGARAVLREKLEAWEELVEERLAASAEIVYRDRAVDGTVMALARDVNVMVNGKTGDPRYLKLFPTAPSQALKPVGGETQGRFVLGVLKRIKDDADYKSVAKHAKPIREALDALDGAEAQRSELMVSEAAARSELVAATIAAQRVYNETWHKLSLLFTDDDALVESFFLTLSAGTATDDSAPEPVDGGGEGDAPVENPVPVVKRARKKKGRK